MRRCFDAEREFHGPHPGPPITMTVRKPRNRGPKRNPISQGVRFDVFRRDDFTCIYCGGGSPQVTLEIDHRTPVSNGGNDEMENLVTSCSDCNRGKGSKTVSVRSSATRTASNDNGLIGFYGHTLDDAGDIDWQFQIVGSVGAASCTIQLFSWLDGRPTDVKVMPIEDLSSARCRLYSTQKEWVAAASHALSWDDRRERLAERRLAIRSVA